MRIRRATQLLRNESAPKRQRMRRAMTPAESAHLALRGTIHRVPRCLCGFCALCVKFFLRPARRIEMPEPTYEELKAQVEQLQKQSGSKRSGALDFRVGEKGGVSVYGLGRFPVTLYYEQWIRLLGASEELKAFLEEQKSAGKLKLKE